MRKSAFCTVLASFLFAASQAPAEIMNNLENPGDMQDVSGISLISGWAFSTTNPSATVTVKLRINGATRNDITIPWGSSRQDVVDAFPMAPLNSGFGLLFAYAVLDPATTTSIGVELSAPNEPTKLVDHLLMIAKPGNAAFLNNFILGPTANIAVDGNEIVIGGAQVTFNGGSTKTNLRIEYATNLQSLVITQAFDGANATLFNPVQAIFTKNCALVGCHAGSNSQQGQDLSAGNSWKNIVAVRSMEDPSRPRVSPGNDDNSYLYQKIIPNGNIAPGTLRMPQGCSGNNCLSQQEIDAIENWINDGARPPQ